MAQRLIRITSDVKKLFKKFDNFDNKTYKSAEKLSQAMGRRFHARVKRNILALGHDNHPGHNTPRELVEHLRLRKIKGISKEGNVGEWKVDMTKYKLDPMWVEEGTRAHLIPVKWGNSQREAFHPGARPTWFWKKAVNTYKEVDMPEIAKGFKFPKF